MYDVAPTCSTQSNIGSRKNGTGGAATGTSPATGGMSPTGTSPDGVVVVEDGVVDALGVVTGGNVLISIPLITLNKTCTGTYVGSNARGENKSLAVSPTLIVTVK